jgi:ABC-type Fe3+-siderophore transport system permease subunit
VPFETALSTALLGGFLWAVGFLLPRAARERDRLALASALLTAVFMLVAWLIVGVRLASP